MFNLIMSVGLSILLNALNFEVLAPLQAIFIADIGKQVVMDQIEGVDDEIFTDLFDDAQLGEWESTIFGDY